MTNGPALAAAAHCSPAHAFGFVWNSWRRLAARHFQYTVLAGTALGAYDSFALALLADEPSFKFAFFNGLLPNLLLAVLLLLCLAVASNVRAERIPRWVPFVVAAVVATAATMAVGYVLPRVGAGVNVAPFPDQGPPDVMYFVRWALQRPLPFAILVALGYMYGLDAWKRAGALHDAQLERTRMSRKAYESRLQALQARVDPRFLFESLASIETTYAANAAMGQRMLDDLIVYLRAALPALDEPSSSLGTELALVRAWLGIMHMRCGNQLAFAIDASDSVRDARMPPMVLLPLVQFAADPDADPASRKATVRIVADVADGRTRVVTTATGSAFVVRADAPELAQIRDRLQALYGHDASLALRGSASSESEALLEIPYESTDRRHR